MFDFERDDIYNYDQEIELRNESVVKDNDGNDIFGNNSLDDIFKNTEKDLFSDDPFQAFSNLPSKSLSSSSSSSALHWSYQPNQIHEFNMHSNPDALQLGPDNLVQEPNFFDDLDLLDPKNGFDDFSMFPDDCFVNHQDPDIPKIDQPSKLIERNANHSANDNSNLATASAPKCHDPDLSRMFLDWLKFNRGSVSLEDLRTIKLKKSTIENAAAQLGNNKEGKMKLVQLVLTWVQEHRLRKKKHPQVEIPNCPYPHSKDYQLPHECVNNQSAANPNFDPNYLRDCNSQPNWNMRIPFSTDYGLLDVNHPMQGNAGMAGSTSAREEARRRRMERKRRLSASHLHKTKYIRPESEIGIGPSNRFCKYDNKPNNLRTDWQKLHNYVSPNLVKMAPNIANVQNSFSTFMEKMKARTVVLKFLFQKVLKQSDVSSLGRFVLPKEAEEHLPMLKERVRMSVQMDDINLFCAWDLYYRFWPNSNSRIYVLENTGEFVRLNELQEGDTVAFYLNVKNNRYMIKGMKMRHKEAMKTCTDPAMEKDHQKINSDPGTSDKKNKTIIDVDDYLVKIPSNSNRD